WDLDAIPGWGLEFSPHGRTEGRGEPPRSSGSEMLPPLADQILRIRIARDTPGPVGPKFTDLYPNPFNPATTIGIFMPVAGEVEIDIVDLTGRRVATLARGFRNAGHHSIDWDARGPEGLPVAGGVYLVVLRSGGLTAVRKVLHLK
ncbi:MAG TPA: T9SS type A sorting domain-containing protein, partial [Bacteroidota bacterium]|nr:T9SS type A sorting domain-containing protein [Bacteroidota bacterium]